jgi:hypothetical protein
VVRPPNGGRTRRRGTQDGGGSPFSLLLVSSSSVGRLGGDGSHSLPCGAKKKERGEGVLGFDGEDVAPILFKRKSRVAVG